MRTLCGRLRLERGEDSEDLPRACVPFELGFLEDRFAVAHDLEPSLAGGDQLHLRRWILALDLGRQTDGPWLVVSKRAVFDRDGHGLIS